MRARVTKLIGLRLLPLMAALLLSAGPALAMPPLAGRSGHAAAPPAAAVTLALCATAGSVTLPDSTVAPIWGFSNFSGSSCDPAQLPGPVLDVAVGDVVTVILFNDLSENVSMVFPGQNLIPDTVGAAPGGTVSYTFTAGAPGTYLYESGTNPGIQVPMGLYGALIVRPAAPNQAYDGAGSAYDQEAVLVLSEIDPDLNSSPSTFNLLDYDPRYWLINGEAYPDTDLIGVTAGDRVLLRYLNAGAIHHTMSLLGLHQRIIAKDAFELNFPFDAVAETTAAGQTTDAIAVVPSGALLGASFPLYNRQLHVTNGSAFPGGMMTFLSVAAVPPTPTPTPTPTDTPTPTPTFTPTPVPTTLADLIFADGFEAGSFSAWSLEQDTENDLRVTAGSALVGTRGMAARIDNTTAMYVQTNSPTNETRYRARFYFDPNGLVMPANNSHIIFQASNPTNTAIVQLLLWFESGGYALHGQTRLDGGAWANTAHFVLSDASHFIEIDWLAATSAGANNGSFSLWIDGVLQVTLSGLDNDTRRAETVRLGPLSGIDAGTAGTAFFDAFESRRTTYIGP